ncbi:DEAD/DEAH box helicase [Mycolicibacterium neworleansense]|uniref:DEAD/DEAH box helicase n=1 Tax=Mycolicibacterium neworleansense TaxID=146018 RepID=A0A0H5S6V7_9MYCO|nr:DEAD/DEAH box helicase [Mycolicibacterium neworleansense]MCV7361595.1 DEAD/DEAH box helicase [Mycolicibacterium neworleansense]CRZ16949.1 DEAD/DEAH box helicase [Mycolicibacterium neworleansense]
MDIFEVHRKLIDDYRAFTTGGVDIRDERIREVVEQGLADGRQWPEPWVSLNPMFASGGTIDELVTEGLLDKGCSYIFREKQTVEDRGSGPITLHKHQRDAVETARTGKSYVLTTGTGSGKSLAYIVPIVDHVLRLGSNRPKGVKAIIVYPMNALANSQRDELRKFLVHGFGDGNEPVTFARYTGQDDDDDRERTLANPPDILLTNYVMLELLLTRPNERKALIGAAHTLKFLVLDELHTYRGRQGADVGMLVRRVRDACGSGDLQCIGTSATMASGDSIAEQKEAVAQVATQIFGDEVTPDRVIGETLTRATAAGELTDVNLSESSYEHLANHSFAGWIEDAFGLKVQEGQLVRQRPQRVSEVARELAKRVQVSEADASAAIRNVLLVGSNAIDPATKRPLFGFRLHQFLSKGEGVLVSLEPEGQRHISTSYQVKVPGKPDHLLLPVSFCRECGQEYIVVTRINRGDRTVYRSRNDREVADSDGDGYLYVSSDFGWPQDPEAEERYPESWLEQGQLKPNMVKYQPRRVRVLADGTETNSGGTEAAFISGPFRFCLRCAVAYQRAGTTDFARLAPLDAEGRSSAMTMISSSIVRSLKGLPEDALPNDARKLLTFVDNRQDASLQAGHFNDFVQVTQLRGALYRAVADESDGLTHEDVARRVTQALGLDFAEYASSAEAEFGMRRKAESALRAVVEFRLYADLQRGWRVTMPNLEQTGLLHIEYDSLQEIAASEKLWAETHPAIRDADSVTRHDVCFNLLEQMRRELAIDVECLSEYGFERVFNQSTQHLVELWQLTSSDKLGHNSKIGITDTSDPRTRTLAPRITPRSAIGRYVREKLRDHDGLRLSEADTGLVLGQLLSRLEKAGLLVDAMDEVRPGLGYRVRAAALIWKAGDGTAGVVDATRKRVGGDGGRVNRFFHDLYRDTAVTLRGLRSKEHTAQVSTVDRERREGEFKEAELPLLFCSPTMELGVDIKGLNAVGLRNVPPTPANYAQRSGRAGRSGQPALVVTYCASGNSHDHYYFRRSEDMVAGSVAPPRLDLANEALLRSHLHAIWLAETDEHLNSSMRGVLDLDAPGFPIKHDIKEFLTKDGAVARATARAEQVIEPLKPGLRETTWWTDDWVERTMRSAYRKFDEACDRWRALYRAAQADRAKFHAIVGNHSANTKEIEGAKLRRAQAENQLRLLVNEDTGQLFSDFYTYRYFAAEGFLPGYSFPRLPLAAFIPGRSGPKDGDYIQRPRFLAINEFGPNALIYHEGSRYEVVRIQLPMDSSSEGNLVTSSARTCEACGYHHDRGSGLELCEYCGSVLPLAKPGLMRMETVFTRRRERISSDEEERRRAGFEIATSFRFTPNHNRDDATVADANGLIAELAYGDTALIRRTNLGRRRRKKTGEQGFWLDLARGTWLSEKAAGDLDDDDSDYEDVGKVKLKDRVIPYVEDTRNIMLFRVAGPISDEMAVTLQYALERGIEAVFQLEDSELSSELLPDPQEHGRTLFTESAEGGAGILRRIVSEPDALARAARKALDICHFDPDGTDTNVDCVQACYDCLLSYGNQPHHEQIDRHLVREILMRLAGAATTQKPRAKAEDLERQSTSILERDFLEYAKTRGLRLPTEAQRKIDALKVRPDFAYRLDNGLAVAVFLDGPVHDAESVVERDAAAEERLLDAGWEIVRFRYDDDWDAIVRGHEWVFGKLKETAQ